MKSICQELMMILKSRRVAIHRVSHKSFNLTNLRNPLNLRASAIDQYS